MALVSAADCRNGSNWDITATTPSTLAVIASNVTVRRRTRMVSARMMNSPETIPAATEAATTAAVPHRRRLMMPVIPPT